MPTFNRATYALIAASVAILNACSTRSGTRESKTVNGQTADSSFQALAHEVIEDHLSRNPSQATDLGVHRWDAQIEDLSQGRVAAETKAMKGFRDRLASVDTTSLSLANRADRDLLIGQ